MSSFPKIPESRGECQPCLQTAHQKTKKGSLGLDNKKGRTWETHGGEAYEQLLMSTQMFSQPFRKTLGSRAMVDHVEQVLGTQEEFHLPTLQSFGFCLHPSSKLHASETLDQSGRNLNLLLFPSLWLFGGWGLPWCSLI